MHLGMNRDRLATIQDIADIHGISRNHLMKVVHQLGVSGIVETVRGRHGGFRLNKKPAEINIGAVVRATETDFFMAECFDRVNSTCVYTPSCSLKGVLRSATIAYLGVLDGVTLEDLIKKSGQRAGKNPSARPIRVYPTPREVQGARSKKSKGQGS